MFINKIVIFALVFLSAIYLCSCGEGNVDITQAKYEPKIVIDGYIYPGRKVDDIKITRNFPLNSTIDAAQVVLSSADVTLTELSSDGKSYKLTYDPQRLSFFYNGSDLTVKPGVSYKLDVKATVEGKLLQASSTTTVPLNGFQVEQKYLTPMYYREKDASGVLKNFTIRFRPSSNTDFYAISIVPQHADLSSFIYNNAYFKPDSSDIKDDFDNYKYQSRWIQNVNANAPGIEYKIEWFDTWFYGEYKAIVYAADKNFADFIVTNGSVQEMDGNFHEPKQHVQGDGIGIFGSAIADTVYFSIKK